MTRSQGRAGFTFLEVICCLLVLVLGLTSVVGLVLWGFKLSARAQARSSAMPTAVSVAVDPQPQLPLDLVSWWTYTPLHIDAYGPITGMATGFINGYYVVRSEQSSDADVVSRDPGTGLVYARSVGVDVDVYDTIQGSVLASYSTRLVRQRSSP